MTSVLSLFGFRGRMRRSSYVLLTVVTLPVSVVSFFLFIIGAVLAVLKLLPPDFAKQIMTQEPQVRPLFETPAAVVLPLLIVSAMVLAVLIPAWIASAVRRLHDMNVTGWAVLGLIAVACIPLFALQTFWQNFAGFVLVGILLSVWPASSAATRYAADPRQSPEQLDDLSFSQGVRP